MVDSAGDLQIVFNNGGLKGAGKYAVYKAIEELDAKTLNCYAMGGGERYHVKWWISL
jgi:hypothetical protein